MAQKNKSFICAFNEMKQFAHFHLAQFLWGKALEHCSSFIIIHEVP